MLRVEPNHILCSWICHLLRQVIQSVKDPVSWLQHTVMSSNFSSAVVKNTPWHNNGKYKFQDICSFGGNVQRDDLCSIVYNSIIGPENG